MIVRRAGLLRLGDYKLLLHHTEIQNMYAFDRAIYKLQNDMLLLSSCKYIKQSWKQKSNYKKSQSAFSCNLNVGIFESQGCLEYLVIFSVRYQEDDQMHKSMALFLAQATSTFMRAQIWSKILRLEKKILQKQCKTILTELRHYKNIIFSVHLLYFFHSPVDDQIWWERKRLAQSYSQ